MRRRLFLGTLLTTATGATIGTMTGARAADAFPYGDSHAFAAWRNGEMIGRHVLHFHGDTTQRHVTTSIDFAVRMLGMAVYKFTYRCHETWAGSAFQGLDAETEDDGKKYVVHARGTPAGLDVVHEGPPSLIKVATAGEETLRSGHDLLPAGTLPSTHWNIVQTRQTGLLHTEFGALYKVAVAKGGRETIRTEKGTLAATRYDYTGELQLTQWFDDRNRWVKGIFRAPDGSSIDYILQE